jgi:hypothetical protein
MPIFIKLHNHEDELVGVEKLDPPHWVKVLNNGTIVLCDREREAQGVQDATGSVIYQLSDRTAIGDPAIIRTATVITEAEYDELSQDYPEPTPQPDDPDDDIAPMTLPEMRQKIEELQAANDTLTECVLEMSEIIYG